MESHAVVQIAYRENLFETQVPIQHRWKPTSTQNVVKISCYIANGLHSGTFSYNQQDRTWIGCDMSVGLDHNPACDVGLIIMRLFTKHSYLTADTN